MAKYIVLDTSLESVADAIREKTGKNDTLEFPNEFVDEINTIGEWQRPSEWMPYANGWNNTNFEGIYFVYDLIDNNENYPDWWAILVKTNSGQFKYDIGYVESTGNFVVSESYQENSNEVIGDFLPTQQEFGNRYFVVRILPLEANHLRGVYFQQCRTSKIQEKYGNNSSNNSDSRLQSCVEIYGQLPHATDMGNSFRCRYLIHANLLNLNSLTSIYQMFDACNCLQKIDGLETWDTKNVTSMESTFAGCYKLSDLSKIENWDVSSVIYLKQTFLDCFSIKELNLSKWEISSNCINLQFMFRGTKCLKIIYVPKGDYSNVFATDLIRDSYCEKIIFNSDFSSSSFGYFFYQALNLKEIDLSNVNTSRVQNLSNMFLNCYFLKEINFNGLDTSKVTNMQSFAKGSGVKKIDFTGCDFSSITNTADDLFSQCYNLIRLKGFVYYKSFKLNDSTHMPTENLVEVLTNLPTVSETQTITLGSTNLSKLTSEQIAIATAKGWTVA